ncbi:MAG: LysR family transcriptional regulator [Rhizobiales bacterium]|nr:LysR family transcriptional regulator [Hyphomicrobiales bacterium]
MFDLRDMQLLVALKRHGHFGRAAMECGISQPAFSSRIRNLELELDVSLVQRGNRFMGLTPEGEIALKWARKMLLDADGMRQELTVSTKTLEGNLVIGVIPTALAVAARLPSIIAKAHPKLRIEITSASSTEIKRGLEDFSFNAGISYIDDNVPASVEAIFFYPETYYLLAPRHLFETPPAAIRWADAARLPLCLLSRTMRNRRIIEEVFTELGISIDPVMETNALTVSLAQVENGYTATIVPEALIGMLPISAQVLALELIEPEVRRSVGLLLPNRTPVPPAHKVLLDAIALAVR